MSSRVIFITGGSGKFGQALVAHFLARGDVVATTTRSEQSLASLLDRHAEAVTQGRFHGVAVDFQRPDACAAIGAFLDERQLRPTGLVNNARSLSFLRIGADGVVARDDFVGELTIDVVVPYELTMALAAIDGCALTHVVNIGSQYGVVAANTRLYDDPKAQSAIHYSVAKAALVHLTRELAVRLIGRGIQVNCVSFGGVEGRVDQAFLERYAKLCPMERMLREDEVAGPVEYLLSPACAGMVGHNLVVDGGWSAW